MQYPRLAVDSDMLFMGSDWLSDLIRTMQATQHLYILAAERNCATSGYVEPVSGTSIDSAETFSTWLFCTRTSLREHTTTSFDFYKDEASATQKRPLCYDTGGRLLQDMRLQGLEFATMPASYRWKYHHFGALSWIDSHAPQQRLREFKEAQLADIKRRLTRLGA
jgi:hypothetical protein